MTSPRWIADEMVGRLARYLRMVGCDTVYARGLSDDEILRRSRAEERVIVTRDRQLAARTSRSLLLESPNIADQWRAVRAAYPDLAEEVQFARCTECNGTLERMQGPAPEPRTEGVPWDRVAQGLPLYRCMSCGHFYWEGTHTTELRERMARWAKGSGR